MLRLSLHRPVRVELLYAFQRISRVTSTAPRATRLLDGHGFDQMTRTIENNRVKWPSGFEITATGY